jgi:very-short-patch-repair endonuclease
VLRTRTTTLSRLQRALELTPSRPGNRERRALLSDSRDEPWSQAERRFHRLLRVAGITGWRANRPVEYQGETFYIDVRFRRLMLAIEIDGWEFHNSQEVFESDRRRQDLLVINGWRVLRFTWRMITDEPEWVISVLRTAMQQK